MSTLPELLEATNLVAAAAALLIALLVARELWRMQLGSPPVAVALIGFFAVLAVDRIAAPDPFLGYSAALDAATDVALIALLALLVAHARRLARGMLATLDASPTPRTRVRTRQAPLHTTRATPHREPPVSDQGRRPHPRTH